MKQILGLSFFLLALTATAQLESHQGDNGKMGFMDNDRWVIQPVYEKVSEFYDYTIAGVKLNGKWGFIDRSGKTVLPFQYNEINDNEGPYLSVSSGNKFGVLDLVKGTEVIKCQYDKQFNFDTGLFSSLGMVALVKHNGKEGIVNMSGTELVACLYDPNSIQEEDSAHFTVKIGKKQGLIDLKGATIIPCQFDQVMLNSDGFYDTSKGKKKGLYSREGKEIAACIYDNFILFEPDGFAIVLLKGKYGLIDRSGTLVLSCKYGNDDEMQEAREKLRKN